MIPGLIVGEHELQVPLDHANPGGDQITVFAREVAEPDGREKPYVIFLQGGPGHESPRPTGNPRAACPNQTAMYQRSGSNEPQACANAFMPRTGNPTPA